jgi:glycerophosphoryl diester phosphodiesterase
MSLAAARVLRPDWPRALIAFKVPSDWEAALEALGCASFHLSSKVLNPPFVAEIKCAGYQVAAFTVNQKRRARELIACEVDCLISDAPDRIASVIGPLDGENGSASAVRQAGR